MRPRMVPIPAAPRPGRPLTRMQAPCSTSFTRWGSQDHRWSLPVTKRTDRCWPGQSRAADSPSFLPFALAQRPCRADTATPPRSPFIVPFGSGSRVSRNE